MTRQSARKAPQSAGQLPYGARTVYHCRTQAVDFLRSKGGPIGVTLIIDTANAKKLRSAIKTCADAAKKIRTGKVQIDARWGRNMLEQGGYRLDVKVWSH
jgi:hypothetical protein